MQTVIWIGYAIERKSRESCLSIKLWISKTLVTNVTSQVTDYLSVADFARYAYFMFLIVFSSFRCGELAVWVALQRTSI